MIHNHCIHNHRCRFYFIGDYNSVEDPDNPGNTSNTQAGNFRVYDGMVYLRAADGVHNQPNGKPAVTMARTDANPGNGVQFYDAVNWNPDPDYEARILGEKSLRLFQAIALKRYNIIKKYDKDLF